MKKLIINSLLLLLITFSVETMAQESQPENTVTPRGITPGRAKALVGGVMGLISVIAGGMTISRSKTKTGNNGRNGALVALITGGAAVVLSIVHLTNTTGGFGTGGGRAGAIVAMVLGLAGTGLGGRVLTKLKNNKNTNQ